MRIMGVGMLMWQKSWPLYYSDGCLGATALKGHHDCSIGPCELLASF